MGGLCSVGNNCVCVGGGLEQEHGFYFFLVFAYDSVYLSIRLLNSYRSCNITCSSI